MTTHESNNASARGSDELTAAVAMRLLSGCVRAERRPVDDLIERLHEPDAVSWLEVALNREGLDADSRMALLNGTMSLDELQVMKDASKTRTVDAATRDESLSALLIYVLCVAAGMLHHGRLLSTQQREVWDDTWVRLSDVMLKPWRNLLLGAVAT